MTPPKKLERTDRRYLLDVADGPECIRIFTSEEEGLVDWSEDIPALYIEVSLYDAYVKLGPFKMKTIRAGVEKAFSRLEPFIRHADSCNVNRLRSTEPDCTVCNCGLREALGK